MENKKLLNQLNKETKYHSIRTAKIARNIAKEMNLNAKLAYKIGLYHDVGKIFIPGRILKKASNLTDVEREVIDLHAYFGYRILKECKIKEDVYIPVLYHHGSPKYKGENVPSASSEQLLYASIIATADCFDALTNNRVYHKKITKEETWSIIEGISHCSEDALNALKKIYK